MLTGAWLPYSPFAGSIGLVPLPYTFWFWIIGFLLIYSVLTHFVKVWFLKKYGGN
jgi:Mg2+-importing ATPase